jgi:hypothetical protein
MFPKIRKIASAEEAQRVIEAARANNDAIDFPSHILERDGEIVGALSMGVVPLVLVWTHTEKVSAKDSLHIVRAKDIIMETKGFDNYVIACNKHSNYNRFMGKLGYNPIWETELFVGGVKGR